MRHFLWAIVCVLCTMTMVSAAPPLRRMPGRPVRSPMAPAFTYNPNFIYPPTAYILPQPVNPNYPIAPGLTLNQFTYNQAMMGRAYSFYPPWVFGYNPYAQFINYGPVVNPYTMNPYLSAFPNPYANYSYGAYYYNPYTLTTGY